MAETVINPNFPPVTAPEDHYKFLASVGISRARLANTCVMRCPVVGISSIADNTVKIDLDGTVHDDIPVWIHTDYGTRRRWLKDEEAVDPADYFERAALIFPMPGGIGIVLVETAEEGEKVALGVVGVDSAFGFDLFSPSPPKPTPPRKGCHPTWKLYLDIRIYCNDWEHTSKYEPPSRKRAYHRLVYDMHEQKVASILNQDQTGFIDAECSMVDAETPTTEETENEEVLNVFLKRGTQIGGTHWRQGDGSARINRGGQVYTDFHGIDWYYVGGNESLWLQPPPLVPPGWAIDHKQEHFDLDGNLFNYAWEGEWDDPLSPHVYTGYLNEAIQPPFSPGDVTVTISGDNDETRQVSCNMAGYGCSFYEINSRIVWAGLAGNDWWTIDHQGYHLVANSYDYYDDERVYWLRYHSGSTSAPLLYEEPYRSGQPAGEVDFFNDRRRYKFNEGDENSFDILFDAYNKDLVLNKTTTYNVNSEGALIPDEFTEFLELSGDWVFEINKIEEGIKTNLHYYKYSFEHTTNYANHIPEGSTVDKTMGFMTPPYMTKLVAENYIHNTLLYSFGIGLATYRVEIDSNYNDSEISFIKRDCDTAFGIIDRTPGESAIDTPNIDLSEIIDQFKSNIALNENPAWFIFDPSIYGLPRGTSSCKPGHIHITCESYLVPYDLREALVE